MLRRNQGESPSGRRGLALRRPMWRRSGRCRSRPPPWSNSISRSATMAASIWKPRQWWSGRSAEWFSADRNPEAGIRITMARTRCRTTTKRGGAGSLPAATWKPAVIGGIPAMAPRSAPEARRAAISRGGPAVIGWPVVPASPAIEVLVVAVSPRPSPAVWSASPGNRHRHGWKAGG
jgi:hypothetical protein